MPDAVRRYEECRVDNWVCCLMSPKRGRTRAYKAVKNAGYDPTSGVVVVDSRLIVNKFL